MKQNVTASLFLICFAFSAAFFGQARGRPQTFEGTITIPNGNTGRPSQPSSLAGTVVSESTGEPISGATVRLRRSFENAVLLLLSEEEAGGTIPPVQTNDKGTFSFEGLVANSYDLAVHLDGYLPVKLGRLNENSRGGYVTLAPGENIRDLRVGLIRSARIEGRIQNDTEQAPGGIPLSLIRDDTARQNVESVTSAASNVDGTYHLSGFLPGRYIVIGGYPLALNGERAQSFAARIDVANHDVQILNVSLDRRGGYGIRGKFGINGTPVVPAEVSMTVRVISPSGTELSPRVNADIPYNYNARDGTFEIPGLFPGVYQINASPRDPQMSGYCAATVVVVSGADVVAPDLTLRQCL